MCGTGSHSVCERVANGCKIEGALPSFSVLRGKVVGHSNKYHVDELVETVEGGKGAKGCV